MGFKKLGLFLFVIILFLIHVRPLHAQPSLNSSTATTGLQRLVLVNRKGGGGGGHGGGHSTGSEAHGGEAKGNGDEGHGATVVPLYAAGAMNRHQHHGSNEGSPKYTSSLYLVLAALVVGIL
ncbi:hypothetical protein P3X46_009844 [Hevea brasiliensis]|uniref:Glycine-rich protein n=1 Tax=Hevea brasiliensis TaxID=3981 RepID=A0ABQ9MC83_HEVBR|nr:uncharacterized protein LOC110663130 [Hevea brasiliensis]KAJ9177916.1 hypothetical protein P3X46_009844 [Hevea brasiliensis]